MTGHELVGVAVKLHRVGVVAKLAQRDVETIRSDIKIGRIRPTKQNGWALFDDAAAARVLAQSLLIQGGVGSDTAAKMANSRLLDEVFGTVADPSIDPPAVALVRVHNVNPRGIAEYQTDLVQISDIGAVIGRTFGSDFVGGPFGGPVVPQAAIVLHVPSLVAEYRRRLAEMSGDVEDAD